MLNKPVLPSESSILDAKRISQAFRLGAIAWPQRRRETEDKDQDTQGKAWGLANSMGKKATIPVNPN